MPCRLAFCGAGIVELGELPAPAVSEDPPISCRRDIQCSFFLFIPAAARILDRGMCNQLPGRQVVRRSCKAHRGNMGCTQLIISMYDRYGKCLEAPRGVQGSKAPGRPCTVAPNTSLTSAYISPLSCTIFLSPLLSCTKVTTKGPKAKRLLGERGGTMPSFTPRS